MAVIGSSLNDGITQIFQSVDCPQSYWDFLAPLTPNQLDFLNTVHGHIIVASAYENPTLVDPYIDYTITTAENDTVSLNFRAADHSLQYYSIQKVGLIETVFFEGG
ncbi:MAG: hypothetical protein SP1CHLAM54_12910 [Chlamydiia bacterium]|nr:hypothetical protein [Chlamydiia bacterium]MCH9616187.1 hypothetical protein [Chlamydiia bacterium]MCH9629827.1 hypothetical protein [Chlamydiia bacterium]